MRVTSPAVSIRGYGSARLYGLLSKISLVTLLLLIAFPVSSGVAFLSLVGFVGFALASIIVRLTSTDVPGDVEIDDRHVTVRRAKAVRKFRREEVLEAVAVDRAIAGAVPVHAVELTVREMGGDGDVVRARTQDRAEAEAIVRALGFGVGGRRVRIDLASASRPLTSLLGLFPAFVAASLLMIVAMTFARPPAQAQFALFAGLLFGAFELVKRAFRAPRWVVGDDGLAIEKPFGRRTFVPRAAIAGIEDGGLPAIVRHDGTKLAAPRGTGIDPERARGAVDALRDRIAGRDPKPVAPDLALGDRSVRELREDLRQRIEQPQYREAATTTDTAEALMKSPDASLDERVAAALALRIAGEPATKIRVAADAFVDDTTREALEAVAADDDAKAERALSRARR